MNIILGRCASPAALLLSCALAMHANAQVPEDFGYRAAPAIGVRPLLTILVSFQEEDARFIMPYGKERFEALFFGDGGQGPNAFGVGGYFHTASNHRFHFSNAGIVGPYENVDDTTTTGDERRWRCLVLQSEPNCSAGPPGQFTHIGNALRAADRDIDFRTFDTNRNGIVTTDELAVVVVEATPAGQDGTGGAFRTPNPASISVDGIRLELAAVAWRSTGDIETLLHEVTHSLDVRDHYGANEFVNRNLAMMSSVQKNNDGRHTVLYDPFTRIRLGWIEPKFVALGQTLDALLVAANDASGGAERAIILYDPARFKNREFFVLEYRTRRNARTGTSGMLELHGLWSEEWQDNMTTTRPSMDGVVGQRFHDRGTTYTYTRSEGLVLPNPIPGVTAPLLSFYHHGRGDHFVSTSATDATNAGYTALGVVGHVFNNSGVARPASAQALYRWWNAERGDNFVTTDPAWIPTSVGQVKDGYRSVGLEGYTVWAPDRNYDADPYGTGDVTVNDDGLAIWHVRMDPATKNVQKVSARAVPAGQVPLGEWESAQRRETFATTTWRADSTIPDVDYRYVGELGRAFTSPSLTRRPLYHRYNESTRDNVTTTDASFAPGAGALVAGYRYVGIVGYLESAATVVATVPIYRHAMSPSDFKLSTNPNLTRAGRLEGYIAPAQEDAGLYIVPVRGVEGAPAEFQGTPQSFWGQGEVAYLRWFNMVRVFRVSVQSMQPEASTMRVHIAPSATP